MASYRSATFGERPVVVRGPPTAGGFVKTVVGSSSPKGSGGKSGSPTTEESIAAILAFHESERRLRKQQHQRSGGNEVLLDGFGNPLHQPKRLKSIDATIDVDAAVSPSSIHGLHTILPSRLALPAHRYQFSPLSFVVDCDWHSAFTAAYAGVSSLNNVSVSVSPAQGSMQCNLDNEVFFLITVRQLDASDADSLGTKQVIELVVQSEEEERVEWPTTLDRVMAHPAFNQWKTARFANPVGAF